MKVTLSLPDFPMLLMEPFKAELAQFVKANIQVGGDTVFVTFETDDVVKAQEGIIICDKYHFTKGAVKDGETYYRGEPREGHS